MICSADLREKVISYIEERGKKLEYLREYSTYFHISRNYGISESTCYRNIRWVEDTLIKR